MKFKYKKYNVGASIARPHLTKPYLNRNTKYQKQNTNENGITVISLIITIIVMLILASVTVYVGTESIDNSRMINFVSYMQIIQTKVDFIAEYEDYSNYGEELSSSNKSTLQSILNSGTESFLTTTSSTYLRYFDSSHIVSDLEIENIDDEIVVDFSTREVISLNGIEYEDEMYYTQYYLPGGQVLKQKTEEITRTVSFGDITSNIDGLNSTFTITNISLTNGTLSYGRKDSADVITWTEITNYTSKGKNVTTRDITESGTYYFKLVDNITGKDSGTADEDGNIVYTSVELRLTNSPKLEDNLTDLSRTYNYSDLNNSEDWAFATDITDEANLLYYVWIPRFVYKLDETGALEELHFLRGTSDITTSGGYINSTDWIEPDVFTNGTSKKTGVWVQVDTPNQTRCRHN